MKVFAFAAALALSSGACFAQDRAALSAEYTNLPAVQRMMDDMFSAEAMAGQIKATLPPNMAVSEDQLARIGTVMAGEMATLRPALQNVMTEVTAEVYTAEELQALIDFNCSEHGAAIMAKMQPMMQMTMARLAPQMAAIQQSAAPKIVEILQESQ